MAKSKKPTVETKKFKTTADLHRYVKEQRAVNKSNEKIKQKVLEDAKAKEEAEAKALEDAEKQKAEALAKLVEEAKELGIKHDKKATAEELQTAIDAKKAELADGGK